MTSTPPPAPAPTIDERDARRCLHCGYNLTGLRERRCPECGQPFDPAELGKAQRRKVLTLPWLVAQVLGVPVLVAVAWPFLTFSLERGIGAMSRMNTVGVLTMSLACPLAFLA